MMNNKTIRMLMNGVLLGAVAAVGVMAYQIVNPPVEEQLYPMETQEERMDTSEEMDTELPSVDAGAANVTAKMDQAGELLEESEEGKTDSLNMEKEDTEQKEYQTDASDGVKSENDYEETAETAAEVSDKFMTSSASLHFSEDALMEWPVQGTILLDYDMDQTVYFPTLDQYRLNPAIAVQAVTGAPVIAGETGMVYSIEEDPKTGTTITMELGDGYQAIYGQLTDLTVCKGERVTKGSVIGYIDTPTKYFSSEGSNLYFAMKKDGKPIDPILYLP